MIDPMNALTIFLMASATYTTRVGGYLFLRNRVLSARSRSVMDSLPGCVLITVIAPDFVTGHLADIVALMSTALAAMRLSILPTVIIGIATAGALRSILG